MPDVIRNLMISSQMIKSEVNEEPPCCQEKENGPIKRVAYDHVICWYTSEILPSSLSFTSYRREEWKFSGQRVI